MKITSFEEIIAWQKAKQMTIEIYHLFTTNKDYGFRDQIQRAAVSVMNNIAEGFERKGNKEFKNFLFIAKGSCAEVRSMVHLAVNLNYISQSAADNLFYKSEEIAKLLSGFIKSLSA